MYDTLVLTPAAAPGQDASPHTMRFAVWPVATGWKATLVTVNGQNVSAQNVHATASDRRRAVLAAADQAGSAGVYDK